MSNKIERRTFIKSGVAASLALSAAPAYLQGKDDRNIKLGFIGIGGRGAGMLKTTMRLTNVSVTAVCDTFPRNLKAAQELVEKTQGSRPDGYGDHELSYLNLLERDDLDGVVIATPWELHIPMTIAAMRAGKYAATEVGPASSVDECWELVNTYEETCVPFAIFGKQRQPHAYKGRDIPHSAIYHDTGTTFYHRTRGCHITTRAGTNVSAHVKNNHITRLCIFG
ncbi:MAG: Gfo/Idh/MocA family oxidoreductase [Verrucomicrobia bacterium]|nr:Gfo/Idh/MocA family oxidoreductase [Verrucomicrobiota bacterium]MDA1068872.1 Gfo/Idh/MocA family oxidoreductase [Verrucomicrobiota bacterium]